MADEHLNFLARLKQHHLYGVVVAYAVVAGFLIQLVSRAFPYFGWVEAVPAVIIVLLLGFPVVVVLAWLFIKPKDPAQSSTWQRRHWKLSATVTVIVIVLVVISGFYGVRFSEHRAERLARASAIASEPKSAITAAPSAATVIPAKSIAVLPFVNESGDKGQQYFSDGLSEDLITALSQFAGLKVISRDSSFQFRNSDDSSQVIGKKLGVAHLLEGSVQRSGDEIRINAELVNAADGTTLWSEHYDRTYKDLFALQDAITKAVAGVLKAKLLTETSSTAVAQSDRPPSGNLAEYNAYLQGQFYYQRGSEADAYKAITQFTAATQLDPHYAAAYAAMSNTWTLLAGYFLSGADKPGAYAEARAAAKTALQLNPDLAAAHGAYAAVLVNADLDWDGAQAELRRALELAPGSTLAKFDLSTRLATRGHPESAIKLVRQALVGNPLQAFWIVWLASYQAALGRLDEAEATAHRAVALQPQAAFTYRELTAIEVLRGDPAAALAAARNTPPGRNKDIAIAWALQIGPDRTAADAALEDLIEKHASDSAYQIAEVYALRKDPDNMFKWLDRAWANRDDGIQYLLYDPFILRYKSDPRFAAFCKKVGLPYTSKDPPSVRAN
ncbi:MAG: tetratricopeptide repeat protein [Gammaproteobacteria bacterium]